MNHTEQLGRLTKDVDMRYTSDNKPVARFTIAVDDRYNKDETDFHPVVAFGKLAEFADKWLSKGTKVIVQGRLKNNNYTDKNGVKHYGYAIVASDIEFAESKNSNQANNNQDDFVNVPDDTELPFN